MSRSKPPILRLGELEPGQYAVFFALLAERAKGATREGKPYYTCRFRDSRRTAAFMVWADGEFFEVCRNEWKEGQIFKIRAVYGEHERFGPQLDIELIRPVQDDDRAEGFDPAEFVDSSRFDSNKMFGELRGLVEKEIGDQPLRALVLAILDAHAERLKRVPATIRAGEPAEFHCSSQAASGAIVERLWDFNDGLPETTANPKHTFAHPGRYRVTLVVWDAAGRGARAEKTIEVAALRPK